VSHQTVGLILVICPQWTNQKHAKTATNPKGTMQRIAEALNVSQRTVSERPS
jgi:hypothetical protein